MLFLNTDNFGCNKDNEMLNRLSSSVEGNLGIIVTDIIRDKSKKSAVFKFPTSEIQKVLFKLGNLEHFSV